MQAKTTKRYWCSRCGSYQAFDVCQGMTRAGDRGFCETTVWSCKNCGFSPFLPPKEKKCPLPPKEEGNEQRDSSNS